MNDEGLGGYIYEILSEKVLSLRDIQRECKNQHPKENQVQRCLSLLYDRGLVNVIKKNGMDMWSLPVEADAQPSIETPIAVSESGDNGARRKRNGETFCGDGRSSDCSGDGHSIGQLQASGGDRRSSGQLQASGGDRCSNSFEDTHSNVSSSHLRGSYAEVAKSHSSTHTNTTQPRGADSVWPLPSAVEETLPLVSKNGDHAARGGRDEKAYSGDRSSTLSSHQSLWDSSAETTRSQNRPKESMCSSTPSNTTHSDTTQPRGVSSLCPQPSQAAGVLVVAEHENTCTPNTIVKSFGRSEISIKGDTRVAEYTSLTPEVQKCLNNFHKILQVLKNAGNPLKATEIAQEAKIGKSRKDVNSALYFLADKGILKKLSDGCPVWTLLNEEWTDESVRESAIEHYRKKNPGVETRLANIPGSPDSRTTGHPHGANCKSCKGPCINIEEKHIHNHTHNYILQSGNVNITNVSSSDAISPVEDQ